MVRPIDIKKVVRDARKKSGAAMKRGRIVTVGFDLTGIPTMSRALN